HRFLMKQHVRLGKAVHDVPAAVGNHVVQIRTHVLEQPRIVVRHPDLHACPPRLGPKPRSLADAFYLASRVKTFLPRERRGATGQERATERRLARPRGGRAAMQKKRTYAPPSRIS